MRRALGLVLTRDSPAGKPHQDSSRKPSPGIHTSTLGQDTGIPRGDISAPGIKEIRKVLLIRRSGQRLGIYLRGGMDLRTGVYVSGLDKGGQAEKQGLRVGDKVLRVNDIDFRQITHADAVKAIKRAARMLIYVTSAHAHRMPVNHKPVKLAPEEEEKERSLTITADSDGYLGCSIRGGSDYGMEVCVSHVDRDSPSHRAGLIRGDVILKINEADVAGMTHMDAVALATRVSELHLIVLQKPGSCILKSTSHTDTEKPRNSSDQSRSTLPQGNTQGTEPNSQWTLLPESPPATFERDHRVLGGNKVTKLISKTFRLNMLTQPSDKEGKSYIKVTSPIGRMLRQRSSPNDILNMVSERQHRISNYEKSWHRSNKSASTSDLNMLNDLMGGTPINSLESTSTPALPIADVKIMNIVEPYEKDISNTAL